MIWIVSVNDRPRAVFDKKEKAYQEICDEFLAWMCYDVNHTDEFLELYNQKQYEKAFHKIPEKEISRYSITKLGGLNISNFVQDE